MEEKIKTDPVPYIVHESDQATNERTIKRLILALVLVVSLMFLSNALWLNAWISYDYADETETITVDSEGEGNANYIGQDGDINNGESNSEENKKNENEKR